MKKSSLIAAHLLTCLLTMTLILGPGPVRASNATPEVILRLHGSNTIGAKLAPALATAFLQETLKARSIRVQPIGLNELRIVADLPQSPVAIEIASHGSSTSFKDLAAGTCDIGMASRPIKDKEKKQLAFLGNMETLFSEHTLGLDGIAVIVHPDNPITSLPMAQLKDIFSGKIKDWSELSPKIKGPIKVHARDEKSGTYDTFKSLVLGKEIALASQASRYESNSKLSDAVADARGAIGFCGLPYILRSKALAIADKGAALIDPSNNTVATEDYPLSRRLYLYTPPYSENIYSRFFIDFAMSERGQDIVENIGFIGQNLKTFSAAKEVHTKPQRQDVVNYLKVATKKAQRVSLNFRFQPGSSRLDDRSERDLIRLARFLRARKNNKILLIGFADNVGDYYHNMELARNRADIVYNRLKQVGAQGAYHILSGSEELPVASNDNEKGRQKNRRVEVWISSSNT